MNLQEAIEAARKLGQEHGKGSASWYFDRTDPSDLELIELLGKLEDCDPEIMDTLPASPFSGEWADGYTPKALYADLEIEEGEFNWAKLDEIADAYLLSYEEAAQASVYKQIFDRLGGEIVIRLNVYDDGGYAVVEQLWPRREHARVAVLHDEDELSVRIEPITKVTP